MTGVQTCALPICFIASGSYSNGLKIYKSSDLELYSTIKKSWFSGSLISIFNSENQLILEIKESRFFGSKFKIIFKHNSILKRQDRKSVV